MPQSKELMVCLTEDEVAALKLAREHVRVHMTQHGWTARDLAMEAIGKVIAASRKETP